MESCAKEKARVMSLTRQSSDGWDATTSEDPAYLKVAILVRLDCAKVAGDMGSVDVHVLVRSGF